MPDGEPHVDLGKWIVHSGFSPKGKYLAHLALLPGDTQSSGLVHVLDESGTLRSSIFRRRSDSKPPFVFSADENWIATVGNDQFGKDSITITPLGLGKPLELRNPGRVRSLGFSPDSTPTLAANKPCPGCAKTHFLAVGGDDSSLSMAERLGLADLGTFGPIVRSKPTEDTLALYEIPSGRRVFLSKHGKQVTALAYGLGGRAVVTVGQDGAFLLEVPVENGKLRPPIREAVAIVEGLSLCCVAFSNRSGNFAVAGRDGSIRLFHVVEDAKPLRVIEKNNFRGPAGINRLVFSPQGDYLAVSGESGMSVFNLDLDRVMEVLHSSMRESVQGLEFSARKQLIAATYDGAKLFNVEAHPRETLTRAPFISVEWLPDGTIATRSDNGRLKIFSRSALGASGRDGTVLEGQPTQIKPEAAFPQLAKFATTPFKAIALSRDGDFLAFNDGRVTTILRRNSGSTQVCQGDEVGVLAFSPDSRYLAVGGSDLQVCETGNGHRFSGLSQKDLRSRGSRSITALEFGPDGQQLLIGTDGGRVAMWRLPGSPQFLSVKLQPVKCLAFSGDGRLFATGEYDRLEGTVKVFDADTLAPRAWITLSGQPLALRFFPKTGKQPPILGTVTQGQTSGELVVEEHLLETVDLITDARSRLPPKSSEKVRLTDSR